MLTQIVAYFIVSQKLAQLEVKREIAKKKSQIRFTLGLFFLANFLGPQRVWHEKLVDTQLDSELIRVVELRRHRARLMFGYWTKKTKATNLSHNIVNWGRL